MKKEKLKVLLIAMCMVCVAFAFSACGSDKDSSSDSSESADTTKATTEPYTNEEGKTRDELNSEEDNFLGTWKGTSATAENLYGSIELTINPDQTFDADVTGEKFSGTWEKIDGGIAFESVYICGEMYFGEKCKMVIFEEGATPVTLKKVD